MFANIFFFGNFKFCFSEKFPTEKVFFHFSKLLIMGRKKNLKKRKRFRAKQSSLHLTVSDTISDGITENKETQNNSTKHKRQTSEEKEEEEEGEKAKEEEEQPDQTVEKQSTCILPVIGSLSPKESYCIKLP